MSAEEQKELGIIKARSSKGRSSTGGKSSYVPKESAGIVITIKT